MSKSIQILLPSLLILLSVFFGISIGRFVNTTTENALSMPAACQYKNIVFIDGSIIKMEFTIPRLILVFFLQDRQLIEPYDKNIPS